MVRIKDDSRTVEITMKAWPGMTTARSYANDFFEIRPLPYNEKIDTYSVQMLTTVLNGRLNGQDRKLIPDSADKNGEDRDDRALIFLIIRRGNSVTLWIRHRLLT